MTKIAGVARPVDEALDGELLLQPMAVIRAVIAAKVGAVLRRHWLAVTLLVAGVVLRALSELAYRPALFYIDTTKYLYDTQGNDPAGYKGPLRGILFIGNFDIVVLVQHLLGLAIAVVIYLLLLRRGVSRWLAALAIAPILLDAYQIQMEQTIMPGSWFEALAVAGFALLLWRPNPGWRAIIWAGLVFGTSATVWQNGEALIPAAVIFVLATGGWRRALARAGVICVACVVPILVYCTASDIFTGAFYLSHTGVTSLYGRTSAAVDCATIRLPADERAMCPDRSQEAQGSDWLEYSLTSPIRPYYKDMPRHKADRLISNFNYSVLTQQPLRVFGAYARDVAKLFAVTRVTDKGDPPISRWQFKTYFPYFPPHAGKATVRQAVNRFGGGKPQVWRPVAEFLRSYQLDGGYTPGPLLLLLSLTGLAGALSVLRRRLDPATRQLALACLLFFASGASILLVADIFVFSWRYQMNALITLVPAGVLGITMILRMLRPKTRRAEFDRVEVPIPAE
jgi:hypothetical protein